MSDEKAHATLSDKRARGSAIGGKQYGFQAASIVSRIPVWLADPEIAKADVLTCYNAISEQYTVDPDRVLVGGFSGGAIAAIDITMAETLPVRGFVTLCPELQPASFTAERVRQAMERGVRGVILEGELVLPTPDEEKMMQILDEVGFPYQLIVNEEIGHMPPTDLEQKLAQSIAYCLT